MRKMIACILLVGLVSLLCLNGYATEYSDPLDSRNIPQEVLELADPNETDVLFRYYRTAIVLAFGESDTIEEVFSSGYVHSIPFYALETETSRTLIYLKDNETYTVIEPTDRDGNWPSSTFQEHRTGEAIRTVSPDIVIESMYYINGENDMTGTAIYYKTDLGDYVFFRDYSFGDLLFSAEAFFEYQAVVYGNVIRASHGLSGYTYNLSAYDYRSANFDPNAPFIVKQNLDSSNLWAAIVACIIPLGAIAAFFIIKAKRKASALPEET